jgi:hypothetical protein
MDSSGAGGLPLIQVETAPGPPDRNAKPTFHDRLMINQRAETAHFRILLLPLRAGDALPEITWDAAKQSALLRSPGQSDTLDFDVADDHRTRFSARRGDKVLIH